MNDKPVLLVVSFGTSRKETREKTIGGIERALADAFPKWEVRRAFTSRRIIDRIRQTEGIEIPDPAEAMEQAWTDGCRRLIVQPTHILPGIEYERLLGQVEKFTDRFADIRVGRPLLTSAQDMDDVIDALVQETRVDDDGQTTIILIGHGTNHEANGVYAAMQERLTERGLTQYLVGTVEETAERCRDRMRAQAGNAERVVLVPLLIVAGEHATVDIGGDAPSSWKNVFGAAGYNVDVQLRGMGEYTPIRQIFVKHAEEVM